MPDNKKLFGFSASRRAVMIAFSVCMTASFAMTKAAHASELGRLNATVKIKQSDLEKPEGVRQIYKKLTKKAVKTCAPRNRKTTDRAAATKICEAHMLDDFVASVNNAALTSYHAARRDRPLPGS